MNKTTHSIYIWSLVFIAIATTIYIAVSGYSYYSLAIEERFYHPQYDWFKPSGIFGQGLGVMGTLMIAFGVSIYIARKRYGFMERYIRLKYLLEFHIFLCTLGPVLILFHTTFKFGGIVSIAFWSMVAVVLSGVIGRFIYIQIPRTIEGRELSIEEIQSKRNEFAQNLKSIPGSDLSFFQLIQEESLPSSWGLKSFIRHRQIKNKLKKELQQSSLSAIEKKKIKKMVAEELYLASKVGRLHQMQKLFKYWHVIHMPFAIIMLIIVVLHVGVAITLGYKWIF